MKAEWMGCRKKFIVVCGEGKAVMECRYGTTKRALQPYSWAVTEYECNMTGC
jgi:hypothetical protein